MTIVERFLQLRTELDAVYEAYWAAETWKDQEVALLRIEKWSIELKELKKQKLQGKIEYRKPDDYTQVASIPFVDGHHSGKGPDVPTCLGRFPIIHRDGDLLPREVYGSNQNASLGYVPISSAHSPNCPCSLCNQGLPVSMVREYPRAQIAYGGDFRAIRDYPFGIEQAWRDSLHPIRTPQRFLVADHPPKVQNWVSSLYIRIKNFAKGVFHGGSTGTPVG